MVVRLLSIVIKQVPYGSIAGKMRNNMRKKIIRTLLVLSITIGIGAAVATPAHASYNCSNQSWVCLFDGTGGTGTRYVVVEPSNQPLCYPLAAFFNDKASSVQNNTNDTITVFEHGNCTGLSWQNIPANSFGNLSTGSFGVSNKVSAVKFP